MTADGDLVPDTGRFDLETDVVVVGGGGCGLTAAIAAAKGGAEVLVLEKQGRPACNTARSGGMVPAAGSRFQRAAGIVEPPEAMAEDLLRKNGRASDPETTLHLCRVAPALVEWLVDSVGVALEFVGDENVVADLRPLTVSEGGALTSFTTIDLSIGDLTGGGYAVVAGDPSSPDACGDISGEGDDVPGEPDAGPRVAATHVGGESRE